MSDGSYFNVHIIFMTWGRWLLPSASNLCATVLCAVSVVTRATSVIFSLIIYCCCSVGHCSHRCCVCVYQWDLSNLPVLWKCEVPDNVALRLSYLNGWVNLGLELQDELYLSYTAGDLVMQQQTLWTSCVMVSCVFFI